MNDGAAASSNSQDRKKVVIVAMSGNTLINFAGPADVCTCADMFLRLSGSKNINDELIGEDVI